MNEIAAPRDAAAGIDIYDVEERLHLAETRCDRARREIEEMESQLD
jgi:hypothetical protein